MHVTMQFSHTTKTELRATATSISIPNPNLFNTPQGSISGALEGCLGTLDAACIEKLLLHCASALENKDVTLAQHIWVLNNFASSLGDPNQRLTSWILRALVSRASRVCPSSPMNFYGSVNTQQRTMSRSMSVTELAGYVDLIPWHRFGFCASNSVILAAIQGHSRVHILDFSITHCMQWPTLIDTLAKRPEGPPSLRITVPSFRPPVPPLLNVPPEDVGLRLANFAKSRGLPFNFNVISNTSSGNLSPEVLLKYLNPSLLNLREDEALIINCQNWLRYLPVEGVGSVQHRSPRDIFLEMISNLRPCIVIIVDEDADVDSPSLESRIATCFNYLWIPFDAFETFLPKDSFQRTSYEEDVGHKIENIVGFEGMQRIERLESGTNLALRMKKSGFVSVPFGEDTMREVKLLLDEHASGWGVKREEEMLVLTWKGHNSVFATAWVPN